MHAKDKEILIEYLEAYIQQGLVKGIRSIKKMAQTFRLYKIYLGSPDRIASGTQTFYTFNPSKV